MYVKKIIAQISNFPTDAGVLYFPVQLRKGNEVCCVALRRRNPFHEQALRRNSTFDSKEDHRTDALSGNSINWMDTIAFHNDPAKFVKLGRYNRTSIIKKVKEVITQVINGSYPLCLFLAATSIS